MYPARSRQANPRIRAEHGPIAPRLLQDRPEDAGAENENAQRLAIPRSLAAALHNVGSGTSWKAGIGSAFVRMSRQSGFVLRMNDTTGVTCDVMASRAASPSCSWRSRAERSQSTEARAAVAPAALRLTTVEVRARAIAWMGTAAIPPAARAARAMVRIARSKVSPVGAVPSTVPAPSRRSTMPARAAMVRSAEARLPRVRVIARTTNFALKDTIAIGAGWRNAPRK